MEFVSIERIFTKVSRDLSHMNVSESDIIEWTGEALQFINALKATEESVAFIKVNNYQCDVPANLHIITQIAKNTKLESNTEPVKSNNDEILDNSKPDYPVYIDCNGAPYDDYNVAYYRPYYDLRWEYDQWRDTSQYQRDYEPVRLSNHHFFNTLVCSEDGSDVGTNGIYNTLKFEYSIIKGKVLRFNFEKGLVAIAYTRNVLDEQGLPMTPDNISFTTAIISYISMKYAKREFLGGNTGAKGRLDVAQSDWEWYVKQASNSELIPKGIDEMEDLADQMVRLIPRRNLYDNYFGNSNNREVKNILNTRR